MEDRKIRDQRINRIIAELLNPVTIKSEKAFESLCFYFYDEDINFIYEVLMRRADTQSIYWLIRYLVGVERPQSFEKLFLLACSEDEFIREEAFSGITKIETGARIEILFRMLDSRLKDQLIFATEQLGKLRASKALFSLLDVLERYRHDEEICVEVIKALGRITDVRSFPALERLASTQEGNVQEAALESLTVLTLFADPLYLRKYIFSDNINMRKIVYRIIIRSPRRKAQDYLAEGLAKETEEDLKIEILSLIGSIKSTRLFRVILKLALDDSSYRVGMIAQSVIRRAKSKLVLKLLLRCERKSKGAAKGLILSFLADYYTESMLVNIFIKNYLYSTNDKIKFIAIESLGKIKDKNSLDFLRQIVEEKGLYSYAACISLGNLVDKSDWDTVAEMLSRDEKDMPLITRVFLRFIMRLPEDYSLPESIERHIIRLSSSNSEYIRYLAVRLLPRIKMADKFDKLILGIKDELFPNVRYAYFKSFTHAIQKELDTSIDILFKHIKDSRLLSVHYTLFKQISLTSGKFSSILDKLIDLIRSSIKQPKEDRRLYTARLMVLLRLMAKRYKAYFLDYIATAGLDDLGEWVVLKILNQTDIHILRNINVNFMADQYKAASKKTKIEYLIFFERMSVRSSLIEDAVFDSLCREKDEELREKIESILSAWVKTVEAGVA